MSVMTVGPVIGRTSDTTSRVLIEVDEDAQVTCTARSGSHEVVRTVDCRAGRPRAFAFDGLEPGRTYRLRFEGADGVQSGRIRTLRADAEAMNVAAVSCNFTIRKGAVDLWNDLRRRYVRPNQVDLLLHCGDQVYGDSAFQEAIDLLGVDDPADRVRNVAPEIEAKILESYRRLHRMTWRHPATREVLASVPNLAIWDDHEIRDDWGSRECDQDARSAARFVGRLARRVYREYQRQLWDDFDVDADPDDGLEGHRHRFGRFGFLFVDQRGGRSFGRDDELPYLGSRQWRQIRAALAPGGELADVQVLVVITSVPLVYLGAAVTDTGASVPQADDLQDHWAWAPHRREQIDMIRLLRDWKTSAPHREIQIVGGDVHVGGHTEIRHHGKPLFQQLITSPITNKPPRWWEFQALRVLLESNQRLSESYSFEHRDFTSKRNYGLLVLRASDGRSPTVRAGLEREP